MDFKEKVKIFFPLLKAHDHGLNVENCNNWFKEFLISNDGNYLFAYFILGNSTLWIFDLTTKKFQTSFCTSMKKCDIESYKKELRNWTEKYPECVAKNWDYSTLN